MMPIEFLNNEEVIYKLSKNNQNTRPTLVEAHIADLHFGSLDSEIQYNILKEQFINPLYDLPQLDIVCIDGDTFDHKFMSNTNPIMYAIKFVLDIVDLCKCKNATFVIIHGTLYHDDNQLRLFYHLLEINDVDIRIVEQVKFEYIKGAKILCIPELYGMNEEYYANFLFKSGEYDSVFMHGAFRGSIFGTQDSEKHSDKSPIFDMSDFSMCHGPIISGHVHNSGCFKSHFYYCGSPYSWKFGEASHKGFLIVLHNLETHQYMVEFNEIKSFRYETFNLNNMLDADPREIINYVESLHQQGIDHIRIEFDKDDLNDNESATMNIISKYYNNNPTVKIKKKDIKKEILINNNNEILDKYKDYQFINDKSLDEFQTLSKFINKKKGYLYTSPEEILEYYNMKI